MGKKGIAALVIGASLACAAGLIGFILLVKAVGERRAVRDAAAQAAREAEVQAQLAAERDGRRAETAAAFADPARPTPADVAEFAPVFAALGRALDGGDADAATRAFDPDRMMRELERIGAFDRLGPNMGAGFKAGVRQGMERTLGATLVANELARWTRTDIRHVRWAADRQEAAVIAVHRGDGPDDMPLRIRWWLVRSGGGWKIYDYEDLHMGLSATRLVAAMATPEGIERVGRNPQGFQRAVAGLRDALVLLGKGDIDGGDAALAPARAVQLPPQVQAILEVAEGTILLARGDPAGGLARYDAADRLLPNMPVTALARANAYVQLGRHDDAIAAVRAYQKELGPDALSCALEGSALEGLGKGAEAAAAYRRALDETPDAADALDGLRRVLPADKKGELGDRLADARDPRKTYDELVDLAREDNDEAALDALLDGLLRLTPDDPRALGDDIRRRVKAEKFAVARGIMERGLKAKEHADRDSILNAYLFAMLGANKALDAYAAVPAAHAERAFRTLADDLEDDLADPEDGKPPERIKVLGELIAAHRKRVPADPWLWFYEGALLQHAKEYAKAAAAFAAGAAKLPPGKPDPESDTDRFRARRVVCLFKLKKGLDAYRDIGPPADTFRQLAYLYDMEKDFDGLDALIAAHRDRKVPDPERAYWQAHLLYRKGEYARAVPAFHKYLDESDEKAPSRWSARDEVVRCVLRTKPADAPRTLAGFGEDKVGLPLQAAVAAAAGDRAELERLLADSAKNGGKTWFYSDEDFRKFFSAERYRDLRAKYPDPNPPPVLDG